MAWRKPVIVAAHGGLVEIVEDGVSGWYVPPNDAAALGAVIAAIMEAPGTVADRGRNALTRFEQDFSTEAMATSLRRTLSQWLARA